jgi:tetratricopeptide (TPR) repeat protein
MKKLTIIGIGLFISVISGCNSVDLNQEIEKGKRQYYNDSVSTAIETFSNALQYSDTCKECLLWRSNSYKEINNLDLALSDLNKLIDIDSTLSYAYANRASVYYLLSDYKNALDDYQQALIIKPDFKALYNPISHMLFINHQKEKACRYYQMAMQIGDSTFNTEIVIYCKSKTNVNNR